VIRENVGGSRYTSSAATCRAIGENPTYPALIASAGSYPDINGSRVNETADLRRRAPHRYGRISSATCGIALRRARAERLKRWLTTRHLPKTVLI
jgi:hypothetical protein